MLARKRKTMRARTPWLMSPRRGGRGPFGDLLGGMIFLFLFGANFIMALYHSTRSTQTQGEPKFVMIHIWRLMLTIEKLYLTTKFSRNSLRVSSFWARG